MYKEPRPTVTSVISLDIFADNDRYLVSIFEESKIVLFHAMTHKFGRLVAPAGRVRERDAILVIAGRSDPPTRGEDGRGHQLSCEEKDEKKGTDHLFTRGSDYAVNLNRRICARSAGAHDFILSDG